MADLEQGASPRVIDFEADAFDMAADNCASKTCTPHLSDLYDFRSVDNATLTGVGTGRVTHIGKAKYVFLDDKGSEILVDDHEVLVCPNLPSRILSVPSWALQLERRHGPLDKTSIKSYGSYSCIKTDQNRLKRTITHHDKKGIPIVRARLADKDSYSAFCACFPCYTVNFDGDDDDTDYRAPDDDTDRRSQRHRDLVPTKPKTSFATTGDPPLIVPDDQQTPHDMLMGYHMRLGHLPFDRLQQAARQGILPRRIADCSIPKCPSCLFGKAKRRPWRHRGQTSHIGPTATKPGDMVSVDQLISKTPGLIAQSTGKMTHRRHTVATIFVDHASGLDYVHTQESTTGAETVEAKEAFERFAARHHVKIKHYHCDNGIFAGTKFRASVLRANQTISFCGVNAHHQNGIAERRIQDLTDRARSMLVNAHHHNPFATDNLWPFALRHASAIDRTLPKKANTKSPLEIFTGVAVRPKTNHFHPFGCPVYVLNVPLQAGKSFPKWDERARVGCYLGISPQHATSISLLVLHPRTGLVSPQFHCILHDSFETLSNLGRFTLLWPPSSKLKTKALASPHYSDTAVPCGIYPPLVPSRR